MKQYHKALLLGGVLALAVVVTGCSAALPPDAQGPLWEEVVKGERANAARGGWTGIGLIVVGVLMMVGSKPWTPFLDRLPLVPKCYHDPSGAGPEAEPAGIGAAAAALGDFCSYA